LLRCKVAAKAEHSKAPDDRAPFLLKVADKLMQFFPENFGLRANQLPTPQP